MCWQQTPFLDLGVGGRMATAPHYTIIQFRMLHVLICNSDIVPVILCGCEICCLTSREEHRLRVCESRVVRRIYDMRGS
jgi:hypothetical protein